MTKGSQLWVALALCGFARPEAVAGGRTEESRNSLRVELCDGTELDATILRAARDEASSIFAKAAARVQWEGDCDVPPSTARDAARIYVVPHLPEVILNEFYRNHGKRNIMGYALANPGQSCAGVIYVARKAVEVVASKSGRISLTEAHLARAMGRVLAHELAHRFLGPGHTRTGILKDHLDQRDLIADENAGLFFDDDQVRALRERIAPQ